MRKIVQKVIIFSFVIFFAPQLAGQMPEPVIDYQKPIIFGQIEMNNGRPVTTMSGDSISGFLDEETTAFRVVPMTWNSLNAQLARYISGSEEIGKSIQWLRTAREIALKCSERDEFWENRKQAATFRPLLRSAMAARIKEPLLVVTEGPGSVCAILHPAIMLTRPEDKSGKTLHSLVLIKNTENLSLEQGIKNDFLDLIVAHEIGHVIMHSLMAAAMKPLNEGKLPHGARKRTNPMLALMEGWAIAFEAFLGQDRKDLNGKPAQLAELPDLVTSRQEPVRRERYIWVDQDSEKRGRLISGNEMMAMEGVIAGLFFDILSSRSITASFDKCCEVFACDRPVTFAEFGRAFLRRFPQDRRVFCRIILENTRCTIMNLDVAGLYRSQYWAKKMYQTGKGSKEAFSSAEKVYYNFKEKLINEAISGGDPFYQVGPIVWLQKWQKRVDINSASRQQLIDYGLPEKQVDKFIAARSKNGYFRGNANQIISEYGE